MQQFGLEARASPKHTAKPRFLWETYIQVILYPPFQIMVRRAKNENLEFGMPAPITHTNRNPTPSRPAPRLGCPLYEHRQLPITCPLAGGLF